MEPDLSNPEQIKQLIAMLQNLLPKEKETVPKKSKPKASSKIKTKTRRLTNKEEQQTNLFLEMPEMGMHKSDTNIDKKLCRHPPTQRNRAYESIKIVCRVCGKSESINPMILPDSSDRYKCNKCSSSSG